MTMAAPLHAPRAIACLAGTAAIALLAGCAIKPIEPWVKPYERERLADPIMKQGSANSPPSRSTTSTPCAKAHAARLALQGGGCWLQLGRPAASRSSRCRRRHARRGHCTGVDLPEIAPRSCTTLRPAAARARRPGGAGPQSMADRVSLSAGYYVDAVSNASIDVVTREPVQETRDEIDLGLDYVVRDTLIKVSGSKSKEPDYLADTVNVDLTQDVFGA